MFIPTGGIARTFGHGTFYSLIKQIMQKAKSVQLIMRFAKCCITSRKCWMILVGVSPFLDPQGDGMSSNFFSGRTDSISAGRSISNDLKRRNFLEVLYKFSCFFFQGTGFYPYRMGEELISGWVVHLFFVKTHNRFAPASLPPWGRNPPLRDLSVPPPQPGAG